MKAHELARILLDGPDGEVVMQKDAEGNGYSPLSGADPAHYVPDSTYSGEVYALNWAAEDCCMIEAEWKEMRAKPKCIVLYPIN